jgi:hypothetical protein
MKKPTGGVRRRDVLKGAGALAGVAAATTITGFPNIAKGQGNAIRIGIVGCGRILAPMHRKEKTGPRTRAVGSARYELISHAMTLMRP